MSTSTYLRRGLAVTGALGLVALAGATPALAAGGASSGHVDVVNTETVQVYLSPEAKVETKRVYEQLALTGHGRVDLLNPVSTQGLRNLDGFGHITTKGGDQVVRTSVDGVKKTRTVSSYTKALPLDVAVHYRLDGRSVQPGDVVGKSGKLQVSFTVTNTTGRSEKVSYTDGKGGTTSRTMKVVVPIVGSLTTTVPGSFTNVRSDQANVAGDGKGGTTLSFTMTLFQPIGSPTTTFGYTADVKDGVVPRVEISALPVNPLQSPTFKSAADSYQGGADTGAQLTDGAVTIDSNLLKLRDGSADLLAGLLKLRDGANQLETGLDGKAAPGAKKLAAGAVALRTGLGQLDSGAARLSDGTSALADGTGKALAGSTRLTAGLKQISGGLGQLGNAQSGVPAAGDGIAQLKAGVDQLIAGVGDKNSPKTLVGGLANLKTGLDALIVPGSTALKNGLVQLRGDGTQTPAGGVSGIRNGLAGAKASLDDKLKQGGDADQLIAGLTSLTTLVPACKNDATCLGTASALLDGAKASKTNLQALSTGLGNAVGGLDLALGGLNDPNAGLIAGAAKLEGGLQSAQSGVNDLNGGAAQVAGGLQQVKGGLAKLATGVEAAVSGINQLQSGAGSAYDGSSQLTAGLGKLDAGANKLDAGASQLSDGAAKASAGSGELSTGAATLASGLATAAGGSTKLADGLRTAAASAPQLPEGATKLSTDGTQKLISAGESTTQTYARNVAVIKAGAKLASTQDMAYGAPKGAQGLTAYSYVVKGDDGQGGRNLTRGLAGLAVLGAGGGVFLLRRRLA